MDILRDGIVLFEESDYSFVEPQPLSPEKALQETREYYEDWFGTAQEFVDGAEFHLGKEHFNLAAFNYHQATERLYHCLFLVRTLYSPKTHNLNRLLDLAEELEPSLKDVRSDEHTSELQSLMRLSYAVFCLQHNH